VWTANTFPRFFAGMMRNFPGLDKWLHGKQTASAGGGPGILAKLGFAVRPLLDMVKPAGVLIGTVLVGAFRVLGTVAIGVLSILKTALVGVWHVFTALAKSALTFGLVLGTIFTIGIARAINYGKELDALSRRHQFAVKDS